MQSKTRLVVSEAKYVRSSHRKNTEKKRVHKTQRIVSTAVVILCCAFLVLGGVQVVSANTAAFQITLDGVALATLPSREEALSAIDRFLEEQSAEMGVSMVPGDNLTIEKVSSRDAVYSSPKDAAAALSAGGIEILAKAVAVCVNGQPVMHVADENAAREAIERAKNHYGSSDVPGVVLEQVGVIGSNVDPEEVLTVQEAANMLLFGNTQVQYHFVETEGERFDYIANRYGLSVEDVQAASPAVDSTNMAVGEAILISAVNPLINIQVTRTEVVQEETGFATERIDNNQMSRGETNIIAEGVAGLEEVTREVVERNGVVLTANRVSAVTLIEPVTQVEEVGTKMTSGAKLASRGIYEGSLGVGQLAWPYYGRGISSRYGMRSLGYHSGLDIQGPIGDPVWAAEAGTIILAEYYYGYGNCVIIDHGDGLETYYGHLSNYAVSVGDKVARGENVGFVGNTGRSTGPHVHFEVRIDGFPYDPIQFLSAFPGTDAEPPAPSVENVALNGAQEEPPAPLEDEQEVQ